MTNFQPFNNIFVLEKYVSDGNPLNIIDKNTDFTLLMFVCDKILHINPDRPWINLAMKILEFPPEQINLSYSNRDGITALILVSGVDVELSLKILSYGSQSANINAVEKDNLMNALMYACTPDTEEVAMEMLSMPTIEVSLKNINRNGYTPLMIACEEGLEDVALSMLEGFNSDSLHLFQKNNRGETAFDLAIGHNHMGNVYRLINEYMNEDQVMANGLDEEEQTIKWATKAMPLIPSFQEPIIDINDLGYDPFLLEERNIRDYLEEDKKDNIVLNYEGKNYLISKSTIERQMEDAIVFECLNAEGIKNFSNIVQNLPLYNIKVIGVDIPKEKTGIWPEFIYLDGIKHIFASDEQLFAIIPLVNDMLVSVISLNEVKKIGTGQGSAYGSLHCQNGQGGMAGIIVSAKANVIGGRKGRSKKRRIVKKRKTIKKRKLYKIKK